MSPALTNLTVHAETMTAIALILLVALRKVILNSLKRLSRSRLTLETESFDLTLQTKQHSLQQELPLHDQGGNDNGRSNDDDGRIPSTGERPKW
jgi:hypothetical protein